MIMKRILLLFNVLLLACGAAVAQGQLAEQQPGTLFAYPVAPDTCSTLESRCNYILAHFWDGYDISKPITDEAAFETTFRDFVGFFRFAHRNVVMSSVRDLINKAQSNTSNLLKLGEVAERALFGGDAEYWSDEVYVAFAKVLAASKQLPREVRDHFASQLTRINSVQVGNVLDFEYIDTDGVKHRFKDLEGKAFVLLFVNDGAASSIGRVRLNTNVALNALLDSGEVTLVCLSMNAYSPEWAAVAAGYAPNWVIGCSANLTNELDLRVAPCIYVLDENHTVLNKSQSVEGLLSAVDPAF